MTYAKTKIFKDLQYYYPIWVFFLNGFLSTCNVVFYTIDQKLTHYDCAQKFHYIVPNKILHICQDPDSSVLGYR